MVEKGGTDDEEEARKAYLAAREDSDRSAQKAIADKTSSALLDRVTKQQSLSLCICHKLWKVLLNLYLRLSSMF